MPSCQRFFDEFAQCLMASECVRSYGKRPQECVESLLKAKLYDRWQKNPATVPPGGIAIPEPEPFAPVECAVSHQSYMECKIHLMNPRKRFRTPYGGAPPKHGEHVFNDDLGAEA
ncbi:hypothetical protein BC831DRAFT_393223, partial [Entophlyctis helioformis]